jgi:hypothetical protein
LKQIGLFEMRRLEALSNTIFGVAMTLLAYDLPKASRFVNAPAWIDPCKCLCPTCHGADDQLYRRRRVLAEATAAKSSSI